VTSVTEKLWRGGLSIIENSIAESRCAYGENRWSGVGMIGGRITQVVFAEPVPGIIRIISLRKATSRECKEYEKAIQNGLEAH
jgi:uncharacterized protein